MTPRYCTAIRIMREAHAGQFDKGGEAYCLHPIRCAMAMPDEETAIVALLHDAIEDTPNPAAIHSAIHEHLGDDILAHVMVLTRCSNETYETYIQRIKQKGGIGITVKLADLYDNLDIRRLQLAAENGHDVAPPVRKYARAVTILTDSQKLF